MSEILISSEVEISEKFDNDFYFDGDKKIGVKITKEDGRISFEKTAKEIYNKYRAFSGWPGTYFQYKDTIIKIHGMHIIELDNDDNPGSILGVTKDGIYFKAIDSVIVITHIQFPGKKIINSCDIYNSYKDFFV